MKSFDFYTPTKIFFGKDRHHEIGEILKGYGFHKILIHYGTGSIKRNGIYDTIVRSIEAQGIAFVELGGVEPNPKLGKVLEAIDLCRREKVEMILAVGGGSVADSAKLTAIGAMEDGNPWAFSVKERIPQKAIPVGIVLTIAAAGSEMSSSCVITNEEIQSKRGFDNPLNRPLFAVMNPELTYTVSPYQTACGVVDILMHTLERYFQPDPDAELTHQIGEALMRSVIDAGKVVMEAPADYEARATLMWASSLSHNGLTGAGKSVGLPVHQLEHEVSGMFDRVAHAAGLSVLFPAWARYVYQMDVMKFCRFAVEVWRCTMNFADPARTALEGIERCEDYFAKILGMPLTLRDLGIEEDSFDSMAEKCTFYGKRTIPGICNLDKKEILDIFKLAKG